MAYEIVALEKWLNHTRWISGENLPPLTPFGLYHFCWVAARQSACEYRRVPELELIGTKVRPDEIVRIASTSQNGRRGGTRKRVRGPRRFRQA